MIDQGGNYINPQGQTPSYWQQQPNPAATGAVNNMIRALLAGNDAYNQGHPAAAAAGVPALVPGSAVSGAAGPTAVGGAAGPAPLPMPDPGTMSGGVGSEFVMGGAPMPQARPVFDAGAAPFGGMDPATAALMSPIPGMGG